MKKAWLWLSIAGAVLVAGLVALWRRAVRQRDIAVEERDIAKRSAIRERVIGDEHRQVEDVAKVTAIAVQVPVLVAVAAGTKAQEQAASAPVDELNRRLEGK